MLYPSIHTAPGWAKNVSFAPILGVCSGKHPWRGSIPIILSLSLIFCILLTIRELIRLLFRFSLLLCHCVLLSVLLPILE